MNRPRPDLATWLVQTKLRPPHARRDAVRRPRLLQALRSAVLGRSVTLVSAPAGYGKTTLLASLPEAVPDYPLAWVTLDAEENDPTRLLATLTAALQRLRPDCGHSVWSWLQGGGPGAAADSGASLRKGIGLLINEILEHLPEPFILVLDDLHFLTRPAVYVGLEYLVDHMPPQMRLVVGTRHDPPLPLARLAARRELAELRRPDLSFTPEEAAELLNTTLGLALSADDLAALQQRTEGWAVGLCLLASSLERIGTAEGRARFLSDMAHTDRYVFDFLADEVLRTQAPEVRTFMLQTAILAELTAEGCRAVTGRADAAEMLEELYRRNLFLVAASEAGAGEASYRYHHLFAQFLTRQLEREMPGDLPELHRRAAGVQQTPGRAIAHYAAAGLWEEAAAVIERATMDVLNRGMFDTLRSWYGALPEPVRNRPMLTALQGRIEIHRGDYEKARELLTRAHEAFIAAGNDAGEAQTLNGLLTVAAQNNDFATVRALIDRSAHLPMQRIGRASVRINQAWIHLFDGQWGAIAAEYDRARAVPAESGDFASSVTVAVFTSPLIAAAPGCLARVEAFCQFADGLAGADSPLRLGLDEQAVWLMLWRGEVAGAQARAERTEALRERMGGYPVLGSDLAAFLATVHGALGHQEEALRYCGLLQDRASRAPHFQWPFWYHAAGRTMALAGRPVEAQLLHDRLAATTGGMERTVKPYLKAHLAGLIALVERRYDEAASHLELGARLEAELPVAGAIGSARMLLARLQCERKRPDLALVLAEPVLAAWADEGVPGRALLDGQAILPVLELAAGAGSAVAARAAALFGHTAPSQAKAAAVGLPEPLSQRELEVLRLLAGGATNREIARALFLGEETVKSHVARLLRKLDATSRTQAAARGRELGLC